ncbi:MULTISPECIES: thiamine-phosphate kinase [unclassified Campylobacter]|uniref:thiamine-phosphate kinase n=1 Tax=unclassified Campylobacter TaxID=2593542 RepID=UPI001473C6F5|nr:MULTISPECIES: thiamine-phosphate kinase [unclassified Campylobacter]
MDKEQRIIDKFSNSFIGDDGAVVGKWVYSKDLFAQDSHFKLGWLSLDEIAYKAMIVNISDAIAMNAVPKYALLGLGLPKKMSEAEISLLHKGFKRACDEFGITIIGGDTISSDKIFISVTIISHLSGKAVYRNSAKTGDLIAYTGKLGESLKGLKSLMRGAQIGKNSRFKKPKLRAKFFYSASKFISSAMDISDGLETDLARLAKASKKGVKFSKKPTKNELKSGEEYEMLFTFSAKNLSRIENEAKKARVKINIFGKITKGRHKTHAKQHHF